MGDTLQRNHLINDCLEVRVATVPVHPIFVCQREREGEGQKERVHERGKEGEGERE